MNQQTPINNTALFQTGRQRKPEAVKSWWLDQTTVDGFTAAAEREAVRMRRSIGAAMVQGGIIVGHIKAKG